MATKNPKLVYETIIRTTPKKLFEALLDPKMTAQYDHGLHIDVPSTKKGTPFQFNDAKKNAIVLGEMIEARKYSKLVYTFQFTFKKDKPSRITFEIKKMGVNVLLTVIHDQFGRETPTYKIVKAGWIETLSSLKTLLETGKALALK